MEMNNTIAALATAKVKSALAIIRLSGPDVFSIVGRCLSDSARLTKSAFRQVNLFRLQHPTTNNSIDEVTLIRYEAPKSFTGEHMVEIICHGGPVVVDEALDALYCAGARAAGRGEFSRRAFLNGKIDLMKAEAIRGIIESQGKIELSCARNLYTRSTNSSIFAWKNALISAILEVDARIEFGEEDDIKSEQLLFPESEILLKLENEISHEIRKREKIKPVEQGSKVILAGPTNAGKSSLFNYIVGSGRSIVHSEPGTTRDIISERFWISNSEIQLFDSAGIRTTSNEVEQQGIERTKSVLLESGIALWVTSSEEALTSLEQDELLALKDSEKAVLVVINKCDLSTPVSKELKIESLGLAYHSVSVKENQNMISLLDKFVALVEYQQNSIELPEVLLNSRHEAIAKGILIEIHEAQKISSHIELVAFHLKNALSRIDELLGKTDNEEIINQIFSTFCIGK